MLLLLGFGFLAGPAAGQDYWVLHSFTGTDGTQLGAGLILSGDTLYGTTELGGCWGQGTLFRMNTDGSGYAVLKHFIGSQGGAWPASDLALSGPTLYGMTYSGGDSNLGTVFRINTDGSGYAVLKSFNGSDGANPRQRLTLSGTNLFGATYYGGTTNRGVVFRLSTDGSGYTVLRDFNDSQGSGAWSDLALSGAALFGTTEYGGDTNRGTVFTLNTDGTGFNVLKSFQGSDGENPRAGLTLSGSTLFGTTFWGGTSNRGTVFRLETNGSAFGVIKSFTGSDGAGPCADVIASGTMLYGTTYSGGASNVGTIFQLDTTTSNYTVLKHCRLSDGANPCAPLTLFGTTLFGTTRFSGGVASTGVVFALALPTATPTVAVRPHDQTVLAGTDAVLTVFASATPPPAYQWFCNGAVIASATNSVLQLTNVQTWQAVPYFVVVSNTSGTATSPPAMFSVVVPGTTPVATPTEAALRAALAGSAPVTFACDGTIFLSNTLSITNDTLLDGSGHQVTISGSGLVRVFSISPSVTLTLRNLTIANGLAVGSGGGVYNGGGTLNAQQCTFSGNVAYAPVAGHNADGSGTDGSAASGGAIYNAGAITLDRCALVENWAVGGGGGAGLGGFETRRGGNGGIGTGGAIHNTSAMTLHACLLSSNGAIGGLGGQGGAGIVQVEPGPAGGPGGLGGEASGGALYNGGTATAINCTFIGNAEIGSAGGPGGRGSTMVVNSHQSIGYPGGNGGNGGSGFGAIADPGGLLHMVNCTVAGNSAAAGSGGVAGGFGDGSHTQPGGVEGTNGTAWGGVNSVGSSLVNTILSANLPGGNWSGTLGDLGHNLSSDATCGFTNSGSLNSTDPLLGPLAANGGPTLTLALLPGSPAIDAGDTSAAPVTDQRGYPRPFGSVADIGAFEYGSVPLLLGITSGPGGFDIGVSGATNRLCALLTATNWGRWTAVVTNQAGADGTTVFHIGSEAQPCRYFRVFSP